LAECCAANRSGSPTADQRTSPYVDEITINDVPEYSGTSSAVVRDTAAGILPIAGVDAMQPLWQVHDRSESGCLLRGQTLDTRQSLPGSLMALRERDAPWTIGVVRRFESARLRGGRARRRAHRTQSATRHDDGRRDRRWEAPEVRRALSSRKRCLPADPDQDVDRSRT
jgi:hypothetical protein